MGIEIPPGLQWVSYLAGEAWPKGDETAMFQIGNDWINSSQQMSALVATLEPVQSETLSVVSGQTASAVAAQFQSLLSGDSSIQNLADQMSSLGGLARQTGTEIQYTKLQILSSLALAAAEIAYALASVDWTFGASLAWIPPVEAITMAMVRALVTTLLRRISTLLAETLTKKGLQQLATKAALSARKLAPEMAKGAAIGAGLSVVQDFAIQEWQVQHGFRDGGIDWGQTFEIALGAVIGGVVSPLAHAAIGTALGESTDIASKLVKGAVTHFGTGVVGNVAGGVATGGGMDAADIFGGAGGGAISGGISGSTEHRHDGAHGDDGESVDGTDGSLDTNGDSGGDDVKIFPSGEPAGTHSGPHDVDVAPGAEPPAPGRGTSVGNTVASLDGSDDSAGPSAPQVSGANGNPSFNDESVPPSTIRTETEAQESPPETTIARQAASGSGNPATPPAGGLSDETPGGTGEGQRSRGGESDAGQGHGEQGAAPGKLADRAKPSPSSTGAAGSTDHQTAVARRSQSSITATSQDSANGPSSSAASESTLGVRHPGTDASGGASRAVPTGKPGIPPVGASPAERSSSSEPTVPVRADVTPAPQPLKVARSHAEPTEPSDPFDGHPAPDTAGRDSEPIGTGDHQGDAADATAPVETAERSMGQSVPDTVTTTDSSEPSAIAVPALAALAPSSHDALSPSSGRHPDSDESSVRVGDVRGGDARFGESEFFELADSRSLRQPSPSVARPDGQAITRSSADTAARDVESEPILGVRSSDSDNGPSGDGAVRRRAGQDHLGANDFGPNRGSDPATGTDTRMTAVAADRGMPSFGAGPDPVPLSRPSFGPRVPGEAWQVLAERDSGRAADVMAQAKLELRSFRDGVSARRRAHAQAEFDDMSFEDTIRQAYGRLDDRQQKGNHLQVAQYVANLVRTGDPVLGAGGADRSRSVDRSDRDARPLRPEPGGWVDQGASSSGSRRRAELGLATSQAPGQTRRHGIEPEAPRASLSASAVGWEPITPGTGRFPFAVSRGAGGLAQSGERPVASRAHAGTSRASGRETEAAVNASSSVVGRAASRAPRGEHGPRDGHEHVSRRSSRHDAPERRSERAGESSKRPREGDEAEGSRKRRRAGSDFPERDSGNYRPRPREATRWATTTWGSEAKYEAENRSRELKERLRRLGGGGDQKGTNGNYSQLQKALIAEYAQGFLASRDDAPILEYELSGYAGLSNELSKNLEDHDSRDALNQIAAKFSQTRWLGRRVRALDIALLANAFSKLDLNPSTAAERGLVKIATHMMIHANLRNYTEQGLALVANGISKLSLNPGSSARRALQRIAEHVVTAGLNAASDPQHLANLANALSKLDPDTIEVARRALESIAAAMIGNDRLNNSKSQELANLANAFSKIATGTNPIARRALETIATHVATAGVNGDYEPQHLANLANAWSKLDLDQSTAATRGLDTIAAHVANADLDGYNPQHLANLANALSKPSPDTGQFARRALEAIAAHVANANLGGYNAHDLAELGNAFGKLSPDTDQVGRWALEAIAAQVVGTDLSGYNAHDLAELGNAFSKLSPDTDQIGRWALEAIAAEVVGADNLSAYSAQHLANLANALSKLSPDTGEVGRWALEAIATRVAETEDFKDYKPQHVANLANAFSKLTTMASLPAKTGLEKLAAVVAHADSEGYKPQELAMVANALSKLDLEQSAAAVHGLDTIAAHVANADLDGYSSQHLANLANAFSKLSPDTDQVGRWALEAIATRVAETEDFKDYESQHVANLANAFSKLTTMASLPAKTGLEGLAAVVAHADSEGYKPQELAMVANALSKLDLEQSAAAVHGLDTIAAHVANADLDGYSPQDLANLANALSKLSPDTGQVGRGALEAIAAQVVGADDLSDYHPQHFANLANALSKLTITSQVGRRALETIAKQVAEADLDTYNSQDLANLANALSKLDLDQSPAASRGLGKIAAHVANADLDGYSPQDLANLANALSKLSPDTGEVGRGALEAIAAQVVGADDLSDYHPQHFANLANALSKLTITSQVGRRALETIAKQVAEADLDTYNSQDLANLANAFSKLDLDQNPAATEALNKVATYVADTDVSKYARQDLASLANAFSKLDLERNPAAISGLSKIATHVTETNWDDHAPQALANLANAIGKLDATASPAAKAGLENIAKTVAAADLNGYDPQALANLANGLSKLDVEASPAVREGLENIAKTVVAADLHDYDPQALANLANALSKLDLDASPTAAQGLAWIAEKVGRGAHWFGGFTQAGLGQLANAFARGEMAAGDVHAQALFTERLHQLADHWGEDPRRLEQAGVLEIATLFKALAKVRLYDDLRALASPGVGRLAQLRKHDDLSGVNLETLGNLSVALLPLVRSPQLRRFREQTLGYLVGLQPLIARKLDLYHSRDLAHPDERFATRNPALTVFQILKTYHVVANMTARAERRRGTAEFGDARLGPDLKAWLDATLRDNRKLIEDDLSSGSWNLIAQLEVENPLDALDEWLRADSQREVDSQVAGVPASFDMAAVLGQMRHEPGPPPADVGLLSLPKVDLRGTPIPDEHPGSDTPRYSILSRLTEGTIKPVGVQLPGKLSGFMLGRTLHVDGVPYRMDLFGGSGMKTEAETLEAIFARKPGQFKAANEGRLVAVPLADTRHDSSFAGLMAKLLPNQESFYYFQRMMLASPPGIAGLRPHDYVLEGSFPIAILPDRHPDEVHPFQLRGGIALRPHDGTGFIKESVAHKMGLFDKARGKLPIFGERPAKLSAHALQHYPRSREVVEEVVEKLRPALAAGSGTAPRGEELFRTLTTGDIRGRHGVAVPASDGKLHLPPRKSGDGVGAAGVLIGRSPYDKPNLRPIDRSQVGEREDATASFLAEATAIQYSFVAAEPAAEQEPHQRLFFAKGVLVLVPDEKWPLDYADRSVVFSAEDIKTHSDWLASKDRNTSDTEMVATGILQATEVFGPGSLAAVPPHEQKKLDGDFDGDAVIIIGDRPALFDHVQRFERELKPLPSLKPPKSHTPAIDQESGHYKFGRGRQILSTKLGTLQRYSSLLLAYLAQSPDTRRWIAERSVFGTYEGLDPHLKQQFRQALEQGERQTSAEQLMAALDGEFDRAHNPDTKTVIGLLRDQLQAWRDDPAPTRDDTAEPPPSSLAGPTQVAERLETLEQTQQEGSELAVRQQIDDTRLLELFPKLEEVNAARTPVDRIEAILNAFPNRMHFDSRGYDPDDLPQSLQNFLSLGIKVGTDAYKSDTGAYIFKQKADRLAALFAQAPNVHSVPYAKAAARRLHAGKFDPHTDREILKDNPTLAAGVMEAGLDLADQHDLLARPAAPEDPIEIAGQHANAHSLAQALHSQAEQQEPHITPTVAQVAHELGTELRDQNKQLRSIGSMRDDLAAMGDTANNRAEHRVSNALRYVIVFPLEHFTQRTREALQELQRAGFSKMRVKNYFLDKNPTFRGVSAVLATEEGYHFTVQIHTPDSYRAKVDNHNTFKASQREKRKTNPDLQQTQELRRLLQDEYAPGKVAIPDQVDSIRDFVPVTGLGVRRGGTQRPDERPAGPPPAGSGERLGRSGAGAGANASTRPHAPRNVPSGPSAHRQSGQPDRIAPHAETPITGRVAGEVRDEGALAGAVPRVPDRLPVDVDLDYEYGRLVEASWVKPGEKDGQTDSPRINPVWYRLSDMPPEVLLFHTDAKWHYGVDAEGHIRIGSAELGAMLSVEELTEQYRYHHQGQLPSTEQLEQFRKSIDGQGHPTIAVEFGDLGQRIDGLPQSRVSGEIVWNRAANRWEVNINSGRYMRGSRAWARTRRPRPSDTEIHRWLGNVAARLSAHLGVPVVTPRSW
ncbi:WXG100-like domain-containing protein [Mycobacterium sp. 050134]|uniref:WXG100-like domain-containing protein n=1 Tax=Mycobacterium sp. 050134 TaxID=3096111 RepID=UPI002EDAF45C